MRGKWWKRWSSFIVAAGLLIGQPGIQPAWAAELSETVFENMEEEIETEISGESAEKMTDEDTAPETIFQTCDSVKASADYASVTYEDLRKTGKKGEWSIYSINSSGGFVDKSGKLVNGKTWDGKWHMYVWYAPDCAEDQQYLLRLGYFLKKCDLDNLEVTLFGARGLSEQLLTSYGISEKVCAVDLSYPCPSKPEERFATSEYLQRGINSVAVSYKLSEEWGDTNASNPSQKNEIMVFVQNPEGKFSRYSYGFPRAGYEWMNSSQSAFLFDDSLISMAVSIITLEHENFPYPSAYDEYPPKPVSPVQFKVEGVFGGRNVTFSNDSKDATIYYSATTSKLTLQDASVKNGETVLFEDFYGTIYARAYKNGVWGNVSRLILKIPVVNKPVISSREGMVTIRTSTPDSYIIYTTDGSAPSLSNGKRLAKSGGSFELPASCMVRAIAVRSCFTNSQEAREYVIGVRPAAPSFDVKGVIGGREVTFNSAATQGEIYYSYTTSNITTGDMHVKPGTTVLFQNYYGTVYAKTYANGQWSNVSRLILRIPKVNTPTFTALGGGRIKISCSTPDTYIYYTTDGSYPSPTNGKRLSAPGIVQVGSGVPLRAIAVRSCFTNSDTTVYCYWD